MTNQPDQSNNSGNKQSPAVSMARYSYLAMVLPSSAFAGWLLGALLEKVVHVSWLHIAGLIFGIIAGFVELARVAVKLGSEK